MNKKTTKLMATALTATMGAGMATQLVQAAEVTPVQAATQAVEAMEKNPTGANIDKAYNAVIALKASATKDALYKRVEKVAAPHHKAVYDIMVTARTKKDLKTIGDARTAVAGMAKIFIKDAYTWSSELDTFTIEYQKTVVDTLNAIADGKKEVKQATINELKEIIVGLELQRSNEGLLKLVLDYSATLDKVQMDYVNEVVALVEKATTVDQIEVARAKYDDLMTMTNTALKEALVKDLGVKLAAKEAELSVLKIESVSAVNPTTLKVSGEALNKLKVDDLTVDGNKVVAITPSADNKTVNVTLESKLAPNKDVTLKVKVEGEVKEFTTKFEYKVSSVTIADVVVDDDLSGQKLKFKVNGETSDADVDYLALAGYSVNFVAVQKTTGTATPLFAGSPAATNTSTSGIISSSLLEGEDYEVEIQLVKSGEALVSDKATVKVRNTEATTNTIDAVKFAVGTTVKYNAALTGSDFRLNSTKLVAGETFYVNAIIATISTEQSIVDESKFSVKTSNPAVISVDSTTKFLTAEAAGTATITVKVGDVEKAYTFTVTNEARKLTTVTANPSSVNVIVNKTTGVTVKTFDQYGDPIGVATGAAIDEVIPTVDVAGTLTKIVNLDVDTTQEGSIGAQTLPLTGAAAGKGTIYFKDANQKVLGSLYVNVSDVDNVASQKLEIVKDPNEIRSNDLNLDLQDDSLVRFQLSNYNSQGIYAGPQDLSKDNQSTPAAYTVTVADPTIAKVNTLNNDEVLDSGEVYFDIVGLKAGKTDVLFKDSTGRIVEKRTITIVNNPIKISSVSWKTAPTIDYEGKVVTVNDVLTITASENDDIVNGIALSKTTAHKVRIVEAVGTTQGELYLDVDGDGVKDSDEVVLGKVEATVATGAEGGNLVGKVSNIFTGLTATAKNDKATVIFKVLVDADGDGNYSSNEAITSTSITIDVK